MERARSLVRRGLIRFPRPQLFPIRQGHPLSTLTPASSAQAAEALLKSFKLQPGDVLVQNEADTDLGKSIIALAKERGIKTINIIADKTGSSHLVEHLKSIGGDIVISESYTNTWFMKRLLSDVPKPVVGLNFSEGFAATAVAKILGEGGTFVSYGVGLPKNVVYPASERFPVEWTQFLKSKKLASQFL